MEIAIDKNDENTDDQTQIILNENYERSSKDEFVVIEENKCFLCLNF